MKIRLLYSFVFAFVAFIALAQNSQQLMDKGWRELIRDNDTLALQYFQQAYDAAEKTGDELSRANALLNLGIASYGSSLFNGLNFATQALRDFESLPETMSVQSTLGRSKCLVLIATIKARQKKYRESLSLASEALSISKKYNDSSSTPGLAAHLLGSVYRSLNQADSSDYYFTEALRCRIQRKDSVYLPVSYVTAGDIALRKGEKQKSYDYYREAFLIASQAHNRQAQVSALLALGKWQQVYNNNARLQDSLYAEAQKIALSVTDKSYIVNVLTETKNLRKLEGKFHEALAIEEQIAGLKETIAGTEKEHLTRSLEVQFGLAEKERELTLIKKEGEISRLTNYLLYSALAFVIIIALAAVILLRRINQRDRQLLRTKEELINSEAEKKKLKEQQLQNEIEFRESQLSALTIQMIQKNELLQELKEKLDTLPADNIDNSINRILNKGLNQDKEWSDFNAHFESINKNFYSRIRQSFPEITSNELKICALIKMNMSSKEMAGILNISPDSVKTARYRLRKKLDLNTEDNLTDFIMSL